MPRCNCARLSCHITAHPTARYVGRSRAWSVSWTRSNGVSAAMTQSQAKTGALSMSPHRSAMVDFPVPWRPVTSTSTTRKDARSALVSGHPAARHFRHRIPEGLSLEGGHRLERGQHQTKLSGQGQSSTLDPRDRAQRYRWQLGESCSTPRRTRSLRGSTLTGPPTPPRCRGTMSPRGCSCAPSATTCAPSAP